METISVMTEGFSVLFKGHVVLKRTKSGMEASTTRRKKSASLKNVSPEWVADNLCDSDIHKLIAGETVGHSVKCGRGFSFVDLKRCSIEEAKKLSACVK
jgi:hypothetical protein